MCTNYIVLMKKIISEKSHFIILNPLLDSQQMAFGMVLSGWYKILPSTGFFSLILTATNLFYRCRHRDNTLSSTCFQKMRGFVHLHCLLLNVISSFACHCWKVFLTKYLLLKKSAQKEISK